MTDDEEFQFLAMAYFGFNFLLIIMGVFQFVAILVRLFCRVVLCYSFPWMEIE